MKYITARNRAALKIKAKHLAAEAKIIRKEEKNWRGDDRAFFRDHRVTTVRNEARATHLSVAFLRGVPYNVLEQKCNETYTRDYIVARRMEAMITKYCTRELKELITDSYVVDQELDLEARHKAKQNHFKTRMRELILEWFDSK